MIHPFTTAMAWRSALPAAEAAVVAATLADMRAAEAAMPAADMRAADMRAAAVAESVFEAPTLNFPF